MAFTSKTGVPIAADTAAMSRLSRDLRAAAPLAWKAYRVRVRELATVVLKDAQSRASFSTRVPSSGRIRVTAGGNVKVIFGGEAAPEASALENKGKGHPRHPLFGNRGFWFTNRTPAFLAPAFDTHQEEIVQGLADAVSTAVEEGIRGR